MQVLFGLLYSTGTSMSFSPHRYIGFFGYTFASKYDFLIFCPVNLKKFYQEGMPKQDTNKRANRKIKRLQNLGSTLWLPMLLCIAVSLRTTKDT